MAATEKSSLDNIWDEPLATPSPPHRRPETTTHEATPQRGRRGPALFLSDDEDEIDPDKDGAISQSNPNPIASTSASATLSARLADIDAHFDGIDDMDDEELLPDLDLDQLRKEAAAKVAARERATGRGVVARDPLDLGGSGAGGGDKAGEDGEEEKEEKKRRPMPKLDEARLLGENGFPLLVKEHKKFKTKGKGHEAADLSKLMQMYQLWAHKMFPKTQFRDTVEKVEKVCRSNRMNIALSVWRDEAEGRKPTGVQSTVDPGDGTDEDKDEEDNDDADGELSSPPQALPASTSSPRISAPKDQPTKTPVGADGDDDFDIDAMIEEEMQTRRQGASLASTSSKPSEKVGHVDDDDDTLWAGMMDLDDVDMGGGDGSGGRDDESMAEMPKDADANTSTKDAPAQEREKAAADDPGDWDDMYFND